MNTVIVEDKNDAISTKCHVKLCAFGLSHVNVCYIQHYPNLATAPNDLADELVAFSDTGDFEDGVYLYVKYESDYNVPNGRALGGVTMFKGRQRIVTVTNSCRTH